MRDRLTATVVVLVVALAWAVVVVVQSGVATGEWLTVIRQTVGLIAVAGLLGRLAAAVDNLVEDMRPGSGGKRTGRFEPVRVRTRPSARTRRSGRRTPPSA